MCAGYGTLLILLDLAPGRVLGTCEHGPAGQPENLDRAPARHPSAEEM